ncbi:MAG: signal recognition particle-docking protein FtsY [Candidatus Methylumidiphilus sp.]
MFRKLALLCVFLTLCVTVMGAYVRISDAGLGCPQWPGCLGLPIVEESANSLPALEPALAESSVPTNPDSAEAWIKTANRYLAGGLGLLVLALFALSFRVKERRLSAVLLSLLALTLVVLLAALGRWGGTLITVPAVVTVHLLAGLATLGVLYWLNLNQSPHATDRPFVSPGLRWLARFGLLVLLLQIALGAWTSANHAGLTCQDFPTCLNSYDPPVNYADAFSLSSEAFNAPPAQLSFAARAAIHWLHRLGAALTFLLLTLLALNLTSNRNAPRLSKPALLLNALLLVQIALGIGAVLLRLPVPIVVAHNVVAALLLLNLLHIVFFLRTPLPGAWRGEPIARRELPEIPAEVVPPPVITPPAEAELRREAPVPAPDNLFGRLKTGLGKTRGGLAGFLVNLALGKKTIDGDLLEDIEGQLLMADIGVAVTSEIIADLTNSLERSQLSDLDALTARLREHLYEIIAPVSQPLVITPDKKPFVILVVGVNGVGKTTTIGKLANRLKNQGLSVMLAAGDTFRAAAVEQLQAWGDRNHIHVVSQGSGADSASVIFDGIQAAKSRNVDVLIADTAGRLHTKSNLMEELTKIKRIMAKLDPAAPHEVLLVLDGGTGQNAISQTKQFNEAVSLTGLAVTKLDGTAKGGVVFALAKQFGIPIRYIGVGETIEDLQDFDARKFIEALFVE